MAKVQKILYDIGGTSFPVKLYVERRNSARMSFGKDAINFRLPSHIANENRRELFDWFEKAVLKAIKKHPELKTRYVGRDFQDGEIIEVGERSYVLAIEKTNKKTHSAKLSNGVIELKMAEGDNIFNRQKAIRHLLSRVVAKDFKPHIVRKVNELNMLYFQKTINSVNLKYNQSNWGSCSTKGNLNLSTRLLFAPEDVIDYVIIHELAHLIEMNHSPRFWKLVSDAMPEYKEKEDWLKVNRDKCDF